MSDNAVRGGEPSGASGQADVAPLIAHLFAKLTDGRFHSGEALASELEVSRSAIWKASRTLRGLGVTIHAVRNRGYRLARAVDPLDATRIMQSLTALARERIIGVETAWSVASTNTLLMERLPPVGSAEAMLAEYQTAGRGRRGRSWIAPPGGGICLSLSWMFREAPRELTALGLVIGVCALRALAAFGLQDVRLKWPNDLLVRDRKLGGILIELRAEAAGPAGVVIGLGLNVALGAELVEDIAQTGLAPVDLVAAGLHHPARNEIAAALISSFVEGLVDFERDGLRPFVQEWLDADALRGREVMVQAAGGNSGGVARGIDLDGALLVETPTGLLRFVSGDVSVRAIS
jgi:BirA family biotin operon repressor/biotin-[acetyl-CoA-carboxylase] ligase